VGMAAEVFIGGSGKRLHLGGAGESFRLPVAFLESFKMEAI
jgi:hypothetical protein